jgi:hypothetical protein
MKGMIMKRDRTVEWCQNQILRLLREQGEIKTYLALSMAVFPKGIKSVEESHNLNRAIANLVIQGLIQRTKDRGGFVVYRLIDKSIPQGGSQ